MNTRNERLGAMRHIIQTEAISNQEELLSRLRDNGFMITQATLSRDVKHLKVSKMHDDSGNYVYHIPNNEPFEAADKEDIMHPHIEFSHHLAVVKTRPGYAMGIASDIDSHAPREILATIAGDDTILVIPREGFSEQSIIHALSHFL